MEHTHLAGGEKEGARAQNSMSDRPRFHAEKNHILIPGRSPDLTGETASMLFQIFRLPRYTEWLLEDPLSCLQWRDRAGLTPASLLCPRGHLECLKETIAQSP